MRVYALGDEPPDRLDDRVSAEERMALVWQLTVQAWALAGREIPTYERAETPIRIIRADERRDRRTEP